MMSSATFSDTPSSVPSVAGAVSDGTTGGCVLEQGSLSTVPCVPLSPTSNVYRWNLPQVHLHSGGKLFQKVFWCVSGHQWWLKVAKYSSYHTFYIPLLLQLHVSNWSELWLWQEEYWSRTLSCISLSKSSESLVMAQSDTEEKEGSMYPSTPPWDIAQFRQWNQQAQHFG